MCILLRFGYFCVYIYTYESSKLRCRSGEVDISGLLGCTLISDGAGESYCVQQYICICAYIYT